MIDLILPCLDEEQALSWVLKSVGENVNPIVVDNGSKDRSAEIARELGATVIECDQPGYGAACNAGAVAATSEFIAFCDCDGSIDTSNVSLLAEEVIDGTYDMIVGRRKPNKWSAMSLQNRIANIELSRRIRKRTGYAIYDLGPLRIAKTEKYLLLDLKDRRSGYPLEVILNAHKQGWRVAQRDVEYLQRSGKSKVTGTLRGTINAVRDMNKVFAK